MGSEQDPTPCNVGLLADLTASSNTVNYPVAPFPVFFSTGGCGGGGGAAAGANFPLYYFPVDCSATGTPLPDNNCLRVLDNTDGHLGPTYDQVLSPSQVNVLPNADNTDNNIFSDPSARLYSWYVPYGYRMIFFHDDVRVTTLKAAFASNKYLEQGPNTLVVDSCLSFLSLADGSTFFSYGSNQPANASNVTCPLAYCAACAVQSGQIPAGPNCPGGPASPQTCTAVTHYAPYFILLKESSFSDLLLDACVQNRTITYGADPNNSLNRVWKPQSPACDNFITALCNVSDVSISPYAELCSCFTQQQALNYQYGNQLQVPVCCFGADPKGDTMKSCTNNPNAYKTGQMLQNCCTYAQCQTLVENNTGMQVKASPPGEIQCVGSFVQFPVVPVTPSAPIPSVIVVDRHSIPLYTWIVFAVAIVLLLLFMFVLLFV